jgi:hypothetical protein
MTTDAERARLIIQAWSKVRDKALHHLLKKAKYYSVPIMPAMASIEAFDPNLIDQCSSSPTQIEYLEFRLQHGYVDGQRLSRVVCDDLVVETIPRIDA